jgi:hypothetical protein
VEHYRLYLDESGDHVFKHFDEPGHRYFCLLGCWFRAGDYQAFHRCLEDFKQRHIPHNPDEPVILHRDDLINRRGPFFRLRDMAARESFDDELIAVIANATFRMVAVVIDKKALQDSYGEEAAHPYHLALGFMLQRYCGYLNHINRRGDVMGESRGGTEDRLLKDSYSLQYRRGAWMRPGAFFQRALTSEQLKLKPKSANIVGLQLADMLANPIRALVLAENGRIPEVPGSFSKRLLAAADPKFNRHLYDGRRCGYGTVFYPK